MTTLTEASIISRKGVRYSIYAILLFMTLRVLLTMSISLYKRIFPPAPTPATVAFGKLSKLPFPERTKHSLSFTLETVSGDLPKFDNNANVYFMPKTISNLLALDFAKEKAKKLGFNSDAQQISESLYKFSHRTTSAVLETNIVTGAFSISYDLNADQAILNMHPPLPEIAAANLKSYLASADLLPDDLTGSPKYKYLKTQSGNFVSAISQSDASLIRVDLFRKSINELNVVTNTPLESNVWFIISGLKERGKEVIAGEYHYFKVDESKVATYPIKTSQVAWQELLNGNYFPASLGTTTEAETIKIRKVYLAYYDPGVYTEFYQPVYVFEGDKDFVGYVPAVSSDYYGE